MLAVGVAVAVAVSVGVAVEMDGKLEGSEQASAAITLKPAARPINQLRRSMHAIINEWLPAVNLAASITSC